MHKALEYCKAKFQYYKSKYGSFAYLDVLVGSVLALSAILGWGFFLSNLGFSSLLLYTKFETPHTNQSLRRAGYGIATLGLLITNLSLCLVLYPILTAAPIYSLFMVPFLVGGGIAYHFLLRASGLKNNFFPGLMALENIHQFIHRSFKRFDGQNVVNQLESGKDLNYISDPDSKLSLALQLGAEKAVSKLIEYGANINSLIPNSTMLEQVTLTAAISEETPNFPKNIRIIRLLAKNGLDINQLSPTDHATSLHLAAELDAIKTAQLLLVFGANPTLENDIQQKALTTKITDLKWRKMLLKHYKKLTLALQPKSLKDIASLALSKTEIDPQKTFLDAASLPAELLAYYQETSTRESRRPKISRDNINKFLDYYETELQPTQEEKAKLGMVP